MADNPKLSDFVGGGYGDFWRFKGRYRVVKGSRASKKSKTAALYYVSQMSKAKYAGANLLVVRKVFRTLHDSCFAELKWAIRRLGVSADWVVRESPLEMTFAPTGQKILFRGLDDPLKLASISVETGALCWIWVEEAYEISDENDFDMLDESLRGELPPGLFKQVTLTLNPWSEGHWIKRRFFDAENPKVFTATTNYTINEWLDDEDRQFFEDLRVRNPRRYRVAGLGDWGVDEGNIFNRAWWRFYDRLPKLDQVIQSWDFTFKESKYSDFVVGQIWGTHGADCYLIDQWRDRADFVRSVAAIREMSKKYPDARRKFVEDKANGSAIISALKREIGGLLPVQPIGSKTARAYAVTPEIESGNVYLPNPAAAPWVNGFIEECAGFPNGMHDDQVDACTQALNQIHKNKGGMRVLTPSNTTRNFL